MPNRIFGESLSELAVVILILWSRLHWRPKSCATWQGRRSNAHQRAVERLPGRTLASDHLVQPLYSDERSLVGALARYAGGGLGEGDAVSEGVVEGPTPTRPMPSAGVRERSGTWAPAPKPSLPNAHRMLPALGIAPNPAIGRSPSRTERARPPPVISAALEPVRSGGAGTERPLVRVRNRACVLLRPVCAERSWCRSSETSVWRAHGQDIPELRRQPRHDERAARPCARSRSDRRRPRVQHSSTQPGVRSLDDRLMVRWVP